MNRRLVEHWLDSASEKSYQSPFCQMLSARGHTILHSTQHTPLEFGKDVLSIDPEGNYCAFQLKGNPSSQLTGAQFRDIQNQLVQLVTNPIITRGKVIPHHKTFLVTNGEIHENAQTALQQLNSGFSDGLPGGRIDTITRGQLIQWAVELGSSLWPSELSDQEHLLRLLVSDGKNIFPIDLLHNLLQSSLNLHEDRVGKISAAALKSRITSAAILTSVGLTNFSKSQNHFATITAWTLFISYCIASCEKQKLSYHHNCEHAVSIAREACFVGLSNICEELRQRSHLIEGDALTDVFVYKWRHTLIISLMSLYWFWCEEDGWPLLEQKDFLESFLPRDFKGTFIWGEAVIPQVLIFLWYLRASEAGSRPDKMLSHFVESVIENNSNSKLGLISPNYSYEDIIRHKNMSLLGIREDIFKDDSFSYNSFFCESLLHLLVRTNMKRDCKLLWPSFSKICHRYFEPDDPWRYCLSYVEDGEEIDTVYAPRQTWDALIKEASDISCQGVPTALRENKYLLMLFTIILPDRAKPSTVRYLGYSFNNSWMISTEPQG